MITALLLALAALAVAGPRAPTPPIAPCDRQQLRVTVTLQPSSQGQMATYRLSNRRRRPCRLAGHARIDIRDAKGRSLGVRQVLQGRGKTVILRARNSHKRPGRSQAAFSAQWSNWCRPKRGIPQWRVGLARGSGTVRAQLAPDSVQPGYYPVCTRSSVRSYAVVFPFH